METLFDPARVEEVKQRLQQLRPESERLWGRMQPEQMLAHCTAGLEMAMGEIRPPRSLIGRLIGRDPERDALVPPTVAKVSVRFSRPLAPPSVNDQNARAGIPLGSVTL